MRLFAWCWFWDGFGYWVWVGVWICFAFNADRGYTSLLIGKQTPSALLSYIFSRESNFKLSLESIRKNSEKSFFRIKFTNFKTSRLVEN